MMTSSKGIGLSVDWIVCTAPNENILHSLIDVSIYFRQSKSVKDWSFRCGDIASGLLDASIYFQQQIFSTY